MNTTLTPIKVIDYPTYHTRNKSEGIEETKIHDIRGIEIAKGFGNIDSAFVPQYGESYYLLYYTYADGDSFNTYNGQISFIGLYRDANLAFKNAAIINDAAHIENLWEIRYRNPPVIKIVDDNRKEYIENIPFDDYFFSFESASVKEVKLIR